MLLYVLLPPKQLTQINDKNVGVKIWTLNLSFEIKMH